MTDNVVQISDYRQHKGEAVYCTYCAFNYFAVYPTLAVFPLECPSCSKMAVIRKVTH